MGLHLGQGQKRVFRDYVPLKVNLKRRELRSPWDRVRIAIISQKMCMRTWDWSALTQKEQTM